MTILLKYFIVYAYLLLVMGVAFTVSKCYKNNEISRNIIHICAGAVWVIYKMLFPATIHPIIISASFVLVTIITTKMKVRFVERENGTLGTIFFTLSMLIMSILGYKNNFLFDIFGIAIICLSFGDATANIVGSRYGKKSIYKSKSIQGTIACLCASAIVMILLKFIFDIQLSFTAILILAVLCSITEIFTGDYDNIAIPAVLYITSFIILSFGINAEFILSILVGVFMFCFSLKLKLLNISASYMLFVFIFVLFYFGGIKSFATIMSIFIVIIVLEKCLQNKVDKIFSEINKENGVRNERQLIANCLVAIISIALYGITNNEIFTVAFVATLAETIGDSVASDVGVLSKTEPVDICSLKRVQRGISGGISIIGTISSLLICIYSAMIYICIYKINLYSFFVIIISSFAGIILDSILGSKIQIQYKCLMCDKLTEKEIHCNKPTIRVKGYKTFDNTRINLICNIFSCVLACILMIMR